MSFLPSLIISSVLCLSLTDIVAQLSTKHIHPLLVFNFYFFMIQTTNLYYERNRPTLLVILSLKELSVPKVEVLFCRVAVTSIISAN
jgi:hypothetical protein